MNRILNARPLILICSIVIHPIGSNDDGKPNYYTILGISCAASQADIRRSYFALTKKMHPDRNHADDAQRSFTDIRAAYDTLYDEARRREYDYALHGYTAEPITCTWLCGFIYDLYTFYRQ